MKKESNNIFNFLTKLIAQFDAKVRFELMASKGSKKEGLALLDKLDETL